ncbi:MULTISPECIES: FCD domain-containing protein [Marinobacter]|uniref:GntR family transcriptional regulator n=1 Tax=Marinobacter profundi TaxID=2666256 RepID=A0A2G1UMH6_9GAMM|nr:MULTISPECIES: FCD domain-containing protein [Marinobacter]MBD3655961.1 FCD domain-containing protein [Marinobacter sp.]PHQ15697.1 GntR family transcriptional regulator [Marinobacter profundi]
MPIAQEITYRLERLILDGGLAPGQKIPSERQLATRLDVSRSIIREALHELQGRGIIETRHGKGSFVSQIVPGPEDERPLMQMFSGHPRTLYDLLEVREQLEGQAAQLAAERATRSDLHRITKAFERLEAADPLSNAPADHAFHQAIVEASHNPVLVHILSSLKNLMLLTVQASVANLNPKEDLRSQIGKHHRQLYHAVLRGQARAAQRIAMAHVRYVREAMQRIEQQGDEVIRMGVSQGTSAKPATAGECRKDVANQE